MSFNGINGRYIIETVGVYCSREYFHGEDEEDEVVIVGDRIWNRDKVTYGCCLEESFDDV